MEPKENPDVCPAGLNDVLNNEVPVFWPAVKPVGVPKLDAVVAPKLGVVPKAVVPVGFAPNRVVPVLLDGA